VYKDAFQYYYEIHLAANANRYTDEEKLKKKTVKVSITPPKVNVKPPKLFNIDVGGETNE
jgi:hypothetical protein